MTAASAPAGRRRRRRFRRAGRCSGRRRAWWRIGRRDRIAGGGVEGEIAGDEMFVMRGSWGWMACQMDWIRLGPPGTSGKLIEAEVSMTKRSGRTGTGLTTKLRTGSKSMGMSTTMAAMRSAMRVAVRDAESGMRSR